MKTYKTWEVIKMLEENPKLKFENLTTKGDYKTIEVCKDMVWWGGNSTYPLHIVVGNKADMWRLVQQPITFMEAANSGKRFKIKKWDCYFSLDDVMASLNALNEDKIKELLNGEWFVEVDNE